MKRVLLINMPFAGIAYPSLALGLFKSRFILNDIPCHIEYLNIKFAEMIGLDDYEFLSQMTALYAGEQMFARVLFGDAIPGDSYYYAEIVQSISPGSQSRLQRIKTKVRPFLNQCLQAVPWERYDIIGFTSLFEQNLPSLSLAYLIKKNDPSKIIVFGGANCEEVMGQTLHKCFPFVDYVFTSEADDTFVEFVKRLSYNHPIDDLPGIVYRQGNDSIISKGTDTVPLLDNLPFPNYDEYYKRLHSSSLPQGINPYILLEASRGCWWGEKVKCAFCGLNGKNIKFRSKTDSRLIDEILHLTRRYKDVFFVQAADNVLDNHFFDKVVPKMANLKLNVQFCFEIRPTLEKHQIKQLANANILYVQPGIENLSTHVLKLMRKGTTALRNIQLLKWCKQYGVLANWNILFGFPGETAQDYQRCFDLAKMITHLGPPTGVGLFRMDRFSHNFENAEDCGFTNVRPQAVFKYIYPFGEKTLLDLVYFFDFDYKESIDDGGVMYALSEHILRWRNNQEQFYSQVVGDKLVIFDARPVAIAPQIALQGIHRHVYEYCDAIRSIWKIKQWLSDTYHLEIGEEKLETLLDGFVRNKLMIRENNMYLSLAVMTYVPEFETNLKKCRVGV